MRSPRPLQLAAAMVGVAVLLPAGASAHVPATGNGLQPTTAGPDLRSAEIQGVGRSTVRYCFDQPVKTTGSAAAFRVRSYDSRRYWFGKSIDANQPASECATVLFGVRVTEGTIGEIADTTATVGINGYGSIPASEPLGGSEVSARESATSGPDLVSVEQDGSVLYFTFDEPIAIPANTPENRAKFGVENQSGTAVIPPSAIDAVPGDTAGKTVRATFGAGEASAAIMAVTFEGAVTDRGFDVGAPTASPAGEVLVAGRLLRNAGGGVYPVSARRIAAQVVEIQFSEPVTPTDSAEFRAYSDAATPSSHAR